MFKLLFWGFCSPESDPPHKIMQYCLYSSIWLVFSFPPLVTTVTGSIFGSLSKTQISKSEFKNEILRSPLLDIQVILLCVCGVDSFNPELEHLIENLFHSLFSKKKPLKSDVWIQIHEMKLRSTSSAEKNFADDIAWITWKTKQDLEI